MKMFYLEIQTTYNTSYKHDKLCNSFRMSYIVFLHKKTFCQPINRKGKQPKKIRKVTK